jgi:putative flippase GtrA
MLGRVARGRASLSAAPRSRPDAFASDLGSQLVRFASIGVMSTVVFALLFAFLAGPLGAFGADVVALAVCSVANTAANRRLTFALRGRTGRARHLAAGLALAALPAGLTLTTLVVLAGLGVRSLAAELAALTIANAGATCARFALLRGWVFRRAPARPQS